MIESLWEFYRTRYDFIVPLIIEHLQIAVIAIIAATMIGVSLGIFIHEKKRLSPIVWDLSAFFIQFPQFLCWAFSFPLVVSAIKVLSSL